ncbi:hypothetical protein GCM10027062_09310 [Nocardioides hungaricus]
MHAESYHRRSDPPNEVATLRGDPTTVGIRLLNRPAIGPPRAVEAQADLRVGTEPHEIGLVKGLPAAPARGSILRRLEALRSTHSSMIARGARNAHGVARRRTEAVGSEPIDGLPQASEPATKTPP